MSSFYKLGGDTVPGKQKCTKIKNPCPRGTYNVMGIGRKKNPHSFPLSCHTPQFIALCWDGICVSPHSNHPFELLIIGFSHDQTHCVYKENLFFSPVKLSFISLFYRLRTVNPSSFSTTLQFLSYRRLNVTMNTKHFEKCLTH